MQQESNHLRLGQILLNAGLLQIAELNTCLEHQNRWGGRIGEILVEQGVVSAQQLVWALAFQLGIPSVDLEEEAIDPYCIGQVPPSFAREHRAFPFKLSLESNTKTFVVAMSDPTLQSSVRILREYLNAPIKIVLVSEAALWDALARFYPTHSILPRIAIKEHSHPRETPRANGNVRSPMVSEDRREDLNVLTEEGAPIGMSDAVNPADILTLDDQELVTLAKRLKARGALTKDDLHASDASQH